MDKLYTRRNARTHLFSSVANLTALDKDVTIFLFTRSLRSFSTSILLVSFSIYLSKLGASAFVIGLIFTGISLFSAFRSFLEGLLSDRFGRKPILLFTAGIMVAGGLVFSVTSHLFLLGITAVVCSVGRGLLFTPAEQAILAEKVKDEKRITAFSVNSFLETIAAAFGGFAAGIPEFLQAKGSGEIASYRPIFIIYALAGLITLISFIPLKETIPRKESVEKREQIKEIPRDEMLFLMKWSIVIAIDLIGGSFIAGFISYWFYVKFGTGPGTFGKLFGATRFIVAISYLVGLKMAQRLGTIKAIVLSRLPVVTVNLLTPMTQNYITAALLILPRALFSMVNVPLRQSYLMGVTKGRRRGSVAGAVTVVSTVTSAGASMITGYIMNYVSISLPFQIAASIQLASATLMYLLFKAIRPSGENVLTTST